MTRTREEGERNKEEDQVSSIYMYTWCYFLGNCDSLVTTKGSQCVPFLLPSVKFWVPDPDIRDALMRCCVSQSYKAFLWHLFPEEIKKAIISVNCADAGVDGDGSTRSMQARKDAAVASFGLDKAKITKASTLPQYRALKPMIYGFLRCVSFAHIIVLCSP